LILFILFFFFSSRRRHTRYIGDWSSDVCSSDLSARPDAQPEGWHGHAGCRGRSEERKGGPGAVPCRQVGRRAMHDRPRFVHAGEIGRASWRERVEKWGVAGWL